MKTFVSNISIRILLIHKHFTIFKFIKIFQIYKNFYLFIADEGLYDQMSKTDRQFDAMLSSINL